MAAIKERRRAELKRSRDFEHTQPDHISRAPSFLSLFFFNLTSKSRLIPHLFFPLPCLSFTISHGHVDSTECFLFQLSYFPGCPPARERLSPPGCGLVRGLATPYAGGLPLLLRLMLMWTRCSVTHGLWKGGREESGRGSGRGRGKRGVLAVLVCARVHTALS